MGGTASESTRMGVFARKKGIGREAGDRDADDDRDERPDGGHRTDDERASMTGSRVEPGGITSIGPQVGSTGSTRSQADSPMPASERRAVSPLDRVVLVRPSASRV